jgi:hypothetical protein
VPGVIVMDVVAHSDYLLPSFPLAGVFTRVRVLWK